MQRFYQQQQQQRQQLQSMAATATATINEYTGMGLSRMSDEDYSSEFGTPRPGTREISAYTSRWIFSQAAKTCARETKRKIVSRTYYRMAANKKVTDAIGSLEKSCNYGVGDEIPQADFRLLKKAIETFNVQIRVFDSVTVSDLVNMRMKAQLELVDDSENKDLVQWITELSNEIRRVNTSRPTGVPSQQAQIMRSSGSTLCNVLSPETIRRKFISLEKLTSAIRTDLIEFLTSEFRKDDRATVVKQIKDSIIHKTRNARNTSQ
jgi:hypothetical protein